MSLRPLYEWEDYTQHSWLSLDELSIGLKGEPADAAKLEPVGPEDVSFTTPRHLRSVILLLDDTVAAKTTDLGPTRWSLTVSCASEFLQKTRRTHPFTIVSVHLFNARDEFRDALENGQLARHKPGESGGPFLARELMLARLTHLREGLAASAGREIIVFFSSYHTLDTPGGPGADKSYSMASVLRCLQDKSYPVAVSVLGFGAHCNFLQRVCDVTGGTYHVAASPMEAHDFTDQLASRVPRTMAAARAPHLLEVGFASISRPSTPQLACLLCDLHRHDVINGPPHTILFHCPRCKSARCRAPFICRTCGLLVVLSTEFSASNFK